MQPIALSMTKLTDGWKSINESFSIDSLYRFSPRAGIFVAIKQIFPSDVFWMGSRFPSSSVTAFQLKPAGQSISTYSLFLFHERVFITETCDGLNSFLITDASILFT